MPPAHFLRNISFLKGLNRSDLESIRKISRLRRFAKGERIFSREQVGSHLFIVMSGRVKIYITSAVGKTKTFAFLEKGDFFGEMALLEGDVRSASALAVKDSELMILCRKDFRRLLQSKPSIMLKMLRILSERLRGANQEIEALTFQNVLSRVVRVLFQLAGKYGRRRGRCILIRTAVTQQELAELAGTARELVTRVLGKLRRMGCITQEGNLLVLADPEKMRNWV